LISLFWGGWRRKTGCVALLMALMLMVGWLRSLTYFEGFSFPGRTPTDYLLSWDSSLVWLRAPGLPFCSDKYPTYLCWKFLGTDERIFQSTHRKWLWNWGGFGSCVGIDHPGDMIVIPYWAVVIPLTFVAAFLLLTKPR
jgi:hypothetical protein